MALEDCPAANENGESQTTKPLGLINVHTCIQFKVGTTFGFLEAIIKLLKDIIIA